MASFGGKLQRERKRRKLTIEQVAETTKIGLRYLRALEKNEFENLPGGVFNRGYVRAYAKAVGGDPEEFVQAYIEAEQRRGIDDRTEDTDLLKASLEASVARRDVPAHSRDESHPIRNVALVSLLSAGLLALAAWFFITPRLAKENPDRGRIVASVTTPDPAVASANDQAPQELPSSFDSSPAAPSKNVETSDEPKTATLVASIGEAPGEPAPSQATFRSPPPPAVVEASPTPIDAAPAPRLSVSHSGVGNGVVNHELQGRTDRFEEGAEAYFWTRVVGGRQGEKIRHVWYHEGERISVSVLTLGGSHWRTHSRRTLRRGGRWTVEMRDERDQVLAREQFECEGADAFRPRRQNLAGLQ